MNQTNALSRLDGIKILKDIHITGTGSITINLLKVIGTVKITEQYAEILSIVSLLNATNVYIDLWDGTVSKDLSLDGAVLSGLPVESFFTKDLDSSKILSVFDASECNFSEIIKSKDIGVPFVISAKHGVDTFLRLNLTTTDTPIDFIIEAVFKFERTGGRSNLLFV